MEEATRKNCFQVIIALALMVFVAMGLVLLYVDCRHSGAPSLELETTLQREDWPIFNGPCFLLQAPIDLQVSWYHSPQRSYDRLVIRKRDNDQLLRIEAHNNDPMPPHKPAREIEIGGMISWHDEEVEDKRFSGAFYVYTPLHYPTFIVATYKNLSGAERDLSIEIVRSIRINDYFPKFEGHVILNFFAEEQLLSPHGSVGPKLPPADGSADCTISHFNYL